jgi:hypothetical protein
MWVYVVCIRVCSSTHRDWLSVYARVHAWRGGRDDSCVCCAHECVHVHAHKTCWTDGFGCLLHPVCACMCVSVLYTCMCASSIKIVLHWLKVCFTINALLMLSYQKCSSLLVCTQLRVCFSYPKGALFIKVCFTNQKRASLIKSVPLLSKVCFTSNVQRRWECASLIQRVLH